MRHVSAGSYVDRILFAVGEAAWACGPAEAARLFRRAFPARPHTGVSYSSRKAACR